MRLSSPVRYGLLVPLVAVTLSARGQAPVVDPRDIDARVARIERALSGSSLLQMHQMLQGLEREIRELRGEIEVQSHELERLQQRQRDLYLDMDRRLQLLEASTSPDPTAAGGTGVPTTRLQTPPPVVASSPPAPSGTTAPPPTPPRRTLPQPPAPVVTSAPPAAVDPGAEQQAYRAAFDLLKNGQFAEASTALTAFLNTYPSGRFADNAQYWLGESYYVSRNFEPALAAFEQLLVSYPDSPKRSHAMLKIGFIHDEMGRKDQALQVLTELTKRYPQSTAASLASKRLKRIQKP